MALSASTIWEVRPTVGSDTNGGAFVAGGSGTDYSQQSSTNTSGVNISTTDGVGNGTTTWTSATGNFTSALVDNLIYLSGTGITTGWYWVTAVGSSTSITLDRSPGTGTGATMNIGGALATISAAFGPIVSGNTVYVKNTGTYTVTTTLGIGSLTAIAVISYGTTRGDGGVTLWTTATNSTPLINANGSSALAVQFLNFSFSNTATTRSLGLTVTQAGYAAWLFQNCTFDGFTTAIQDDWNIAWQLLSLVLIDCEIKNCSDKGINSSGNTLLFGCYIHSCTTAGLYMETPQNNPTYIFDRCVFAACGNGVNFANTQNTTVHITNSGFYNNTSAGFLASSGTGAWRSYVFTNNIFYGNGTYGIDFAAVSGSPISAFVQSNAFGSNTSGARNSFPYGSSADVSLSANPFTNAGSDDFSLNSTAGGGTACKGAGDQGALNGAGSGAIDIGPVQSASGGGGGTTNYIIGKNITQVFTEGY